MEAVGSSVAALILIKMIAAEGNFKQVQKAVEVDLVRICRWIHTIKLDKTRH